MHQLNIKHIMWLVAGLVVVALSLLFWSSYSELKDSRESSNKQIQLAKATIALKEARYFVVQVQQFLTDVGATRSMEAMAEAQTSLEGVRTSLARLVELEPGLAEEARNLEEQAEGLYRAGHDMAEAYIDEGVAAGNAMMKGAGGFDAASAELAERLDRTAAELQQRLDTSIAAVKSDNQHAVDMLMIFNLVVAVVIGLVLLLLYRRVIPPLSQLAQSMQAVAGGSHDLTLRLPVKGNDEVATVARNFNDFVSFICDFMLSTRNNTETLRGMKSEMEEASRRTLEGMQGLQAEVAQVSAAMTQMQASVEEVARNTHEAAQAAGEATEETQGGNRVVARTLDAINHLAEGVEEAATVLARLEEYSNNIGSILDVIRGIAEQTNLLALNAAIEAARAGEQGRGFAVVADEVRSLAQRTQESTEEIYERVTQVQSGTREAVEVMTRSREQAGEAVDEANSAGDALGRIDTAVGRISNMMSQIDEAASQQAEAAEAINRSLVNISSEADRTLGDAEGSRRSSDTLDTRVTDLHQRISGLRLE